MGREKKSTGARGAAVQDPRERRTSVRVRVLLNARLVTTTDELPVKIRDISTGGVMLEGMRPLPKGRDVVLRRGETELFANVAWTDGNMCGLQFDDALSPAELQSFIHQPIGSAPAPVTAPSERPVLTPEILTPEQWRMAQAWGRPAGRDALGD